MPPQKRKSDHQTSPHQPYKKHRSENGTPFNGAHSQGPPPLPPLPPISPPLEKAVFTHASLAVQDPDKPEPVNYERLEFLGDAHLELMASQVIFERYSSSTPGKMSAVREDLVKNETIANFARQYGFDKRLNIGIGNVQPRDWVKIQGDVFEAYICAIVLSDQDPHNGFDAAKKWVTALWQPILAKLGMTMVRNVKSKDALGRALLAPGIRIDYLDEKKPIHDKAKGLQSYFIGAYLTGLGYQKQHLGSGVGESKVAAGQEAAKQALENPLLDVLKTKRAAYLDQREKDKASNLKEESKPVKAGPDAEARPAKEHDPASGIELKYDDERTGVV